MPGGRLKNIVALSKGPQSELSNFDCTERLYRAYRHVSTMISISSNLWIAQYKKQEQKYRESKDAELRGQMSA